MPIDAMMGMYPSALSARTSPGSTASTSPTWPRSTSASYLRASSMRPSLPLRPTARPPAWVIAETSDLFARPANTISTTSIVSSSVTRRPSTNVDTLPRRSSMRVISGPPPCTSTASIPAPFSSTRSSAMVDRPATSRTLPPNLTTTVLPFQAFTYLSPWAITPPAGTASLVATIGVRLIAPSREVVGVFFDVLLRQVACPHRRFRPAEAEVHDDRDGVAGHVPRHFIEDIGIPGRPAALRHEHRPDPDRHPFGLDLGAAAAHRNEDAAPVRRAAVDGRLDERRERDRPRRPVGVFVALRAADGDLDEFGAALGVPRDHAGKVRGAGHERRLERVGRLAGFGDLRRARLPVGEQQDRVVRALVTVDGDPIIGDLRRAPQRRLQHRRRHGRVGCQHGERGRHL